ncbi:hypothetical protein BGZ80_003878 [Entomortierella chlamydospora]|uniref:F-box domain-containing protein n=1 Tax=Entomortierella chlamydospora TaxID=101097 RepID=A0A9P6MNB3_9FUNG|nr:hypothetical protein BGZ79_004548 [Entomortierella chlamydospora]KAG0008082.1 hypothetical protein BGZ80_003878 [Entomortierella chlamydospora]
MHTPGEATAHALSLHEIRTHITQFLSLSDITKAIRVCRQWNDFFNPLVFNAFRIVGNRKNPPLEVLQKYVQYIHRLEFGALSVETPPEYFFLQGCSNLTKLAYVIGNVPRYRVSDLLEKNIKIPMELYDPNGDTKDLDDSDTGFGLFDNFDFVITAKQDPSQPLTSMGLQPGKATTLHPWELARYFVSVHASSLREITLTGSTPTLAFWETLARDCSMTLESLTLASGRIEQRAETAFWMACRNLISLDLSCQFPSCGRNEPTLHVKSTSIPWLDENRPHFFPRMKNIVIRIPQVHPLVELLKNSPNLESLDLTLSPNNIVRVLETLTTIARFDLYSSASSLPSSSTLVRYTTTMSTGEIWTPFHSMSIYCWDISDQQFSALLRFTTRVVNVFACDSGFGDEAMQVMHERFHFMTVREMNLDKCPNVTSKMVNTLLVSCSALEALSADRLYVVDMVQDGSQPWACLNMRELCLNIDLFDPYQGHIESADNDVLEEEGSENDEGANVAEEAGKSMEALQVAERQRLIIAQLAKLRKLKVLCTNRECMDSQDNGPTECVEFILEKGLDQLARLTQLEEIHFSGLERPPRLSEAEWMLKHWKQLRIVHRDRYTVYFDRWDHDLRVMFAAPDGIDNDQKEFDVFP